MADLPANITLEPIPFDEAIAFFSDKVVMDTEDFYMLADEARARAFTVARVTSADIVNDIYQAVGKAITDGETLADFQGRLNQIMAARGWEGLTPWHAETVFRNNIQTAYSAGRWRQMVEEVPYVEYDAVNDSRTRPSHLAHDGKIWPLDHSFWDTWWPPNGHRCRCGVNPVSEEEVEAEGLTVETDDPTGLLYEPKDPATGQKLPARLLMPDQGWDHHPAKIYWEPDLQKYPPSLRAALEKGLVGPQPLEAEDFDDVRQIVADKLQFFVAGKQLKIDRWPSPAAMSTQSDGTITVSLNRFAEAGNFSPALDLEAAFKKLGRKNLSFNEEYALESLWHEINHNRQKFAVNYGLLHGQAPMMETLNQWISRRTYGEMLDALGGFKPRHLETIKAAGYGYRPFVRNFDRLLERLGLAENARLVKELARIHIEVDRYKYAQPTAEVLAAMSGRQADQEKIYDVLLSLGDRDVFEDFLSEL